MTVAAGGAGGIPDVPRSAAKAAAAAADERLLLMVVLAGGVTVAAEGERMAPPGTGWGSIAPGNPAVGRA